MASTRFDGEFDQGIDRVTTLLPEAFAYAHQGNFANLKIKSDGATFLIHTHMEFGLRNSHIRNECMNVHDRF